MAELQPELPLHRGLQLRPFLSPAAAHAAAVTAGGACMRPPAAPPRAFLHAVSRAFSCAFSRAFSHAFSRLVFSFSREAFSRRELAQQACCQRQAPHPRV